MTLPTSGPISIGSVAAELGIGLPLSLGDSRVRELAGVPSGPISLGNLYGKTAGSAAPPPSPLTVQTAGGQGSRSTNAGNVVVSCTVSANASGGTGALTYQWEFISNPGQFVLSNSNQATAGVSKSVARFSSGSGTAGLRVTVRDQAGAVVSAEPVYATLEWYGDIAP